MSTNYVSCKNVRPYVVELVNRCGSWELAAKYINIDRMTVYRILHSKIGEVRKSTARKILIALDSKRKEDSKRKAVNPRMIRAVIAKARLEDNL